MLIFDTESNGLYLPKVVIHKDGTKEIQPPATKFHIFGWTNDGINVETTNDGPTFVRVLQSHDMAGCHNGFVHDFPLIRKLLGYDYQKLKIDTLWLSWYLYPSRVKHSLESFEEEFGIKKVKVSDEEWAEGNLELMTERVTEDVKLNWKLWKKQERLLNQVYE